MTLSSVRDGFTSALVKSPDTLFYCDPPYVHGARGDAHAYACEMSDDDHYRLAELLHSVQGKVALSGYRCELLDSLYKDWYRIDAPPRICHSVKQIRQEVLWTNYDPQGSARAESESPEDILERCYHDALARTEPLIEDERLVPICHYPTNRAPARFLLAC